MYKIFWCGLVYLFIWLCSKCCFLALPFSRTNERDLLTCCFDGYFVGLLSRSAVALQGGRDYRVPSSRHHPQQGTDGAGSREGKALHIFFSPRL